MMQTPINWFEELFLTTGIWGLFGPMLLVFIGVYIANHKDYKPFTTLWFIFILLVIAQYLELVVATPAYWWHILILIIGGVVSLGTAFQD